MAVSKKYLTATAAGVFAMLGIVSSSAAATLGTINSLALTGGPTPNGTQFYDFGLVKLNDQGQVAFQAVTNSNFTESGIFRAQQVGPATLIAKTGQSVGNGAISSLTFSDFNNNGKVLFQAELAGGTGGNRALYLGAGSALHQLAREGSSFLSASITNNRFDYRLTSFEDLNFFEGAQLNDSGQVSFIGGYTAKEPIINGSTTVSGYAAMRANPDGSINMAFERGDAAPLAGGGTLGTIDAFEGPAPLQYKTAIVNNMGHTLVRARSGGLVDEGFYWSNVASLPFHNRKRTVGRDGQTLIPGAPGAIEVLTGNLPLVASHAVDMNDVGEVAFVPQVNPGSPGVLPDLAVYRWSPTAAAQSGAHGLTEIARKGTAVPGGDGQIGYIFFAEVELNNAGQAVFQSSIANSSHGVNDSAIFRGDGNELSVMVRNNMATPDGEHFFGLYGTTVMANDVAVNDAGHVAFHVPLRDEFGDYAGHGLYLTDGIDRVEVTRDGAPLAGSSVSFFSWLGGKGLNKYGQVAFNAQLEDGRSGVFMFTPDRLEWRTAGDGSWDDSMNWTLGIQPDEGRHVYIRPKSNVVIDGPTGAVAVNSLRLGDNEGRSVHELRLAPGSSIIALQNIVLEPSARVVLELGGTGAEQYGRLVADGDFHVAGTLQVTLAEGFSQAAGQQFQLLQANSLGIFGEFEGVKLPGAAPGLLWSTDRLMSHGLLVSTWQADFDEDGDVDGADFTVWNSNGSIDGKATHRQGDANSDGFVDGQDMLVWQQQLGSTAPTPGIGTVPEPGSLVLGVLATGGVATARRRRSR